MSTILADASQQGGIYGDLVLQNAPRDPSSYGSVQEYEAARDQFLNDITSGAFVEAARIFEEQQRLGATAPSSEQTGETVVTPTLTSELGSDDAANVVGAGQAEADRLMSPAAMAGTLEEASSAQGATDIRDAATPRPQPQMRMVSTALMQSLQDEGLRRMAEMGGANLEYAAARAALAPGASQSEMDRVRDLGLAAFRQNFPQFR
jgi:cell division septum initiation protein DivIVA